LDLETIGKTTIAIFRNAFFKSLKYKLSQKCLTIKNHPSGKINNLVQSFMLKLRGIILFFKMAPNIAVVA